MSTVAVLPKAVGWGQETFHMNCHSQTTDARLTASQKGKHQQNPMEAMKTHRQLQKQSKRLHKGGSSSETPLAKTDLH